MTLPSSSSSSSTSPMNTLPPMANATESSLASNVAPCAVPSPESPRHAKKPSMASSMATTSSPVVDGYQTPKTSPDDDVDEDEGHRKDSGAAATEESTVSASDIPAGAIVSPPAPASVPASSATPLSASTIPTSPAAATAMATSVPAVGAARGGVPPDVIRLDLLLVTGQRTRCDFAPSATLAQVKRTLWQQWPQSWPPRPPAVDDVRILHLGHILADNVVLGAQGAATDDEATPRDAQQPSSSSTATPSTASRLLKKRVLNSSSSSSSSPSATTAAASLAPRNLIPGTMTVMHVLVKGGFPSESAQEGEKAAAGGSRGTKADAKEEGGASSAGGGRRGAPHGNGAGDDGAGGCRCIVM